LEVEAQYRELTSLELAFDATLKLKQAAQSSREQKIIDFREELHENTNVLLEISAFKSANSRLREQLFVLQDSRSTVSRPQAQLKNAYEIHELNDEEVRKGNVRVVERTRAVAVRSQGMQQREAGLQQRKIPVDELAQAYETQLQTVLQIEEQTHQIELSLNAVLKEAATLVGCSPTKRGVDRGQRTEEIEKVFGLVTKHDDIF
jgi:outer membrane receptor for Fe3+-dicitrate